MAYWDELDRAQPAPADVNLWPDGDRAPLQITVNKVQPSHEDAMPQLWQTLMKEGDQKQ